MSGELQAVDMVFLVPTVASPSQYAPVLSLQSVNLQISHSEDDISTKADARSRRVFPAGSQSSHSVSGDFVASDEETFATLRAAAESSTPSIMGQLDDGARIYTGLWQITSWTVNGPAFGAVTGSISLVSVGAITASAS